MTATHHPGHLHGGRTGIRRHATIRACQVCGRAVAVGWDDDVCAFLAIADPAPLDPLAELGHLLAGRPLYDAVPAGIGRVNLTARYGPRATVRPFPVLAQHACPGVEPEWSWLPGHTAAAEEDQCPF